MEMKDTKPPVLQNQAQSPKLVPFMEKAVEESITTRMDKDSNQDVDPYKLSEHGREPTITKISMSDASFYTKVACALAKKKIAQIGKKL